MMIVHERYISSIVEYMPTPRPFCLFLVLIIIGSWWQEVGGNITELVFTIDLKANSLEALAGQFQINQTALSNIFLVDPLHNISIGLRAPNVTGLSAEIIPVFNNILEICVDGVNFRNLTILQQACQNCSVCPKTTLSACTVSRDAQCENVCPAGSIEVQNQCSLCAPGKYSSMKGGHWCYACSAGTYAASAGQTACQECPAGTTNSIQTDFVHCVQVCSDPHIYVAHFPILSVIVVC